MTKILTAKEAKKLMMKDEKRNKKIEAYKDKINPAIIRGLKSHRNHGFIKFTYEDYTQIGFEIKKILEDLGFYDIDYNDYNNYLDFKW